MASKTQRNLELVSPAPESSTTDSPRPTTRLITGATPSTYRTAEPRDVEKAAAAWDDEILKCRTDGHRWEDRRAAKNMEYRFIRIVQVCPRCACERITEMDFYGEVFSRSIDYSEGYLLVGLGRISGQGRNVLRMATVERLFKVDTLSGDKALEARPHSRKTREGIGMSEAS